MTAPSPAPPGRPPGQLRCAELENEAWLLRCILDFFRSRREIQAVMGVVDQCLEAAPERQNSEIFKNRGVWDDSAMTD